MPNKPSMKASEILWKGLSALFLLFFLVILRTWMREDFHFVCNEGFLFGFFNFGWLGLLLGGGFLFGSAWLAWHSAFLLERWGWVIIGVAGLSNLSERLFAGCVTDYIFLPFWPAFNGADACLCIGAAFCLYSLFRNRP